MAKDNILDLCKVMQDKHRLVRPAYMQDKYLLLSIDPR